MLLQFLLLSFSILFTAKEESHLIDWSINKPLTWDDFKGQPAPNSTNAALTNSSITIEFGYTNTVLKYNIKCRFNKNLSWGRIKNDHILSHEQGHFDIAEIYARKLNKALSAYAFDRKTVSRDVNAMYDALMKEHHKAQNNYDEETDFSRNFKEQEIWKNKIAEELENLERFGRYSK